MPLADSFICATCGERHAGIPSGLSFDAPIYLGQMSIAEQAASAVIDADTCSIGGQDFFVRGCLEVPVHGQEEPFTWGVWVTLSKVNFDRYVATLGRESSEEGPYFGWLSSRLPGYPDTLNLKTHVHFRAGNLRPRIELEPTDHPLAVDQRSGVSIEALQQVIEANLHSGPAA